MMMTNRNSNQNSKRHLFIYMTALIQQFRANGHIRTAETYQATLNSFRKFRGESDFVQSAGLCRRPGLYPALSDDGGRGKFWADVI